jgi:hypothetical protein
MHVQLSKITLIFLKNISSPIYPYYNYQQASNLYHNHQYK